MVTSFSLRMKECRLVLGMVVFSIANTDLFF